MQLAVMHRAELVVVHELDGIFDRDDVIFLCRIDQVDDRSEGSRFARTGRAGDEHQAGLEVGNASHSDWQIELLPVWRLVWNDAHHDRVSSALSKDVYAKPADAARAVRNIGGAICLEGLDALSITCQHQIGHRLYLRRL